jgi:hypothetical protein
MASKRIITKQSKRKCCSTSIKYKLAILDIWAEKNITGDQAAKEFGVNRTTLCTWKKNEKKWREYADSKRHRVPGGGRKKHPVVTIIPEELQKKPTSEENHFKKPTSIVESLDIPDYTVSELNEVDIQTLKLGEWLNDNVINYYIVNMLPKNNKVYYFNCHAYSWIKNKSTIRCNLDWKEFHYVFVVIFEKNHYSFVVIELGESPKRPIYLFHIDSSPGIHYTKLVAKHITTFLQEQYLSKYATLIPGPKVVVRNTNPCQPNHDDCGVYVLYYMKKIASFIITEESDTLNGWSRELTRGFLEANAIQFREDYLQSYNYMSRSS